MSKVVGSVGSPPNRWGETATGETFPEISLVQARQVRGLLVVLLLLPGLVVRMHQ